MNKVVTFSEQCDNSSLNLSLFGSLLGSTDTWARDDLVEAGTIPSRFRKNRNNWIFIFQQSPITWISPSNKSAESKKSHEVVTRYVVNLSYFEIDDKKSPVYGTWWLLVTQYFYGKVEKNLKNIYSGISIKRTHYKADTSIRGTVWRERIALLCAQTILEKISIKRTSL